MQEIIFLVEEDPEGGFNAQALGHSIFTEGDTERELKHNILDSVKCHFDKGDSPAVIRLHFVREEVMAVHA